MKSSLGELKIEALQYHYDTTMFHELQVIAGLTPYQALLQLLLPSNFINWEVECWVWLSAEDEKRWRIYRAFMKKMA